MKPRGVFTIVEFENPNKSISYRVTGTKLSGERIRENFTVQAEALGRKQHLEIEGANFIPDKRVTTTRLTVEQEAQAERAFAEIAKAAKDGRIPATATVDDAIRYYLDNYREPQKKITVKDAMDKFLLEKKAANLRPLSITNLRVKTLELVKQHEKKLVSEITPDICRELIFATGRSAKTKSNYRRAYSSFFSWASSQGYTASNPIASITPIKAERNDEPEIIGVDQCRRIMNIAAAYKKGALVPYFALAMFAGLRPTELARIGWKAIDIDKQQIKVGSDIAKLRQRRIVEMSDNLADWLLPFVTKKPAIHGKNWRRDFDAIKRLSGFGNPDRKPKWKKKVETPEQKKARVALVPWTQDILRHTAISFKLAECQHEGQTATWAGNSPDVIQRHYKGLVEQEQAKEFWTITPEVGAKILKHRAAA